MVFPHKRGIRTARKPAPTRALSRSRAYPILSVGEHSAAGGPAVGGSGRAHLPWRGLVVLAEGGRAISVKPQHLSDGRHAVGTLACLIGECRGGFRNGTEIVHVVIAAAQQRRAGGRAECCCVELVVPESVICQLSTVGMWTGPPNALDRPKPLSSSRMIRILGALAGALTSKLGGGAAFLALNTVLSGTAALEAATRCGRSVAAPGPGRSPGRKQE
jgi:hypothetical protein